jgi:O-antigen/teichoic acid export membrane protein
MAKPAPGDAVRVLGGRVSSRIVVRGVASVVDQAAFGLITFVVSLFIGRLMGADALGLYATTNALFLLLFSVYNSALLEPMSVFGPRRTPAERRTYRGFLLLGHLAFVAGLVATSAAAIGLWAWAAAPPAVVLHALIATVLYATVITYQWLLRRHWYIESDILSATLQSCLYMFVVLCGLYLLRERPQVEVADIYGVLVLTGVVICAGQSLRLKGVIAMPSRREIRRFSREHWRYGRWVLAGAPLYVCSLHGYYFLAGLMLSIEEVGYLKAAETMIGPFSQIVTGLTMMMLPMTAARIDGMSDEERRRHLLRMLLVLAAAAAGYGTVLVIFGDALVRLAFGDAMGPAAALLPIFAVNALIWAIAEPAFIVLSAVKRPDLFFRSFGIATLSVLTIGPLLMTWIGIEGGALGLMVSWLVLATSQWWFVKRVLFTAPWPVLYAGTK